MKKRRNQIISIIGSALLVGLFAGSAFAASDNASWPAETQDPYFYGYPENQNGMAATTTDVRAFTTQSKNAVSGTTYVTPDNFAWPREHEDPHFYTNVQ